jgi:1-phosphatidylinositol phosphodiesterase
MINTSSRMLAILATLTLGAQAAGNDWMTPLDGGLALSQLSIPGTHDSGASIEPFPGTAKCQNLTISQQLDAGVRFLDIRCRHVNDAFAIYHGSVDQNLTFNAVLDATYAFLSANPGETVIMSIKQEHTASGNTRSFEATFDSYVALNPSKWLPGAVIPTLNEARGKIVLLRRFGATETPKGIDASVWPDQATFTSGSLRVQDEYAVSNNDTKWNGILAVLEEARTGGPGTFYVNFASGYVSGFFGIPNITGVSNNINPRLTGFFTANRSGRFGAILMDFADASRCELIYQTNLPPDIIIPRVAVNLQNSSVTLSWRSEANRIYQPYWSDNLVVWNKLTALPLAGTGEPLTAGDTKRPEKCFYRVVVAPAP